MIRVIALWVAMTFGCCVAQPLVVEADCVDANGVAVGSCRGLVTRADTLLFPSLMFFGSAEVTLRVDGKPWQAATLTLSECGQFVEVVAPGIAPLAQPPAMVSGRVPLGTVLSDIDALQPFTTTVVAYSHSATGVRAIVTDPPPIGAVLADVEGRIVALASSPSAYTVDTFGGFHVSPASLFNDRTRFISEPLTIQAWKTRHGSPQTADVVRSFLSGRDVASTVRDWQAAKRTDPDWGASIDSDVLVACFRPLTLARAWGLADDFGAYLRSRDLGPRLRARSALAVAAKESIQSGNSTPLMELSQRLDANDPLVRDVAMSARLFASFLTRDHKAILEQLEPFCEVFPWDPAPLRLMLLIAAEQKLHTRCIEVATELDRLDWRADSTNAIVGSFLGLDLLDKARATLDVALKRRPTDSSLQYLDALLLGREGRTTEALLIATKLLTTAESGRAAALGWRLVSDRGDSEEVFAFAMSWQQADGSERSYTVPGGWFAERGRWDRVLRILERGKDSYKRASTFGTMLAVALHREGRTDEGLVVANEVWIANPGMLELGIGKASIAFDSGRWDECIAACRKVLASDSSHEKAMGILAMAHREKGDRVEFDKVVTELEAFNKSRAEQLRRSWKESR